MQRIQSAVQAPHSHSTNSAISNEQCIYSFHRDRHCRLCSTKNKNQIHTNPVQLPGTSLPYDVQLCTTSSEVIIIILWWNSMVAMSGDLSLFTFFVFYRLFYMFLTWGRSQLCAVAIGTCLPIVFSVRLFREVPFRLFIRAFVSPRVLFVHSRVLRLRLFVHCHSKCFVLRLIGPAPCLSRPGRSRRMPIKVAVCAAFAVPLVSCILKMVHSIDMALEITLSLIHIWRCRRRG